MEPELHHVTPEELPILRDWLQKYLPESYKIYSTLSETLRGRWVGSTYYTLGWPDIVAAGEGPPPSDSPCYAYHANPRTSSIYAPTPEGLEKLLLHPGFMDWSQHAIFTATSAKLTPVVEKIAQANGGNCTLVRNVLMTVTREDGTLTPRTIPEGYQLRELNADRDGAYVLSTWGHARNHAGLYVNELIRRFPSVGLFDKDGKCIGTNIGNDFGQLGMLYVREEYRCQGLGKTMTSQLAQKYFADGIPAAVCIVKTNEPSIRMHRNLGFKETTDLDWIMYAAGDRKAFLKEIGFTYMDD